MSVYVDRGMQCGHEIVFNGEGDEDFHSEAGDVMCLSVLCRTNSFDRMESISI